MENQKSASDMLWDEVKSLKINIFSIPKVVSDYFERVTVEPNALYLRYKFSSALPALENVLECGGNVKKPKYSMENPMPGTVKITKLA